MDTTIIMSLDGNISCVTGPLWEESTGHWWIPLTKASDAELWCFLWCAPEQTWDLPVIWAAMLFMWLHCYATVPQEISFLFGVFFTLIVQLMFCLVRCWTNERHPFHQWSMSMSLKTIIFITFLQCFLTVDAWLLWRRKLCWFPF